MRRLKSLAVALCLVAAGCGDDGDAANTPDPLTVTSPPAVAQVPKLDLLDGKVFPIEAYKLTPEKIRQLNNAQTLLANECLSRFGFPPSLRPIGQSAADVSLSRRYGITDPAAAAKYGYHVPAGQSEASRPPAEPVSEELSLVLYGPPDPTGTGSGNTDAGSHNGVEIPVGGCMGESKRKLGADEYERVDPDQFASDIELAAGKQADADPRVKEKFAEWSTCMKGSGYDYQDPFQPLDGDTLKASLAQPVPTAAEIQTAVADVECKQQINLVGVWFAVESAYQEQLIEKNAERLAGIKEAIDKVLKAAAAVTG